MKWAIGAILLGAVGVAAIAFFRLDAASAAFFTFAIALVVVMGSAPVILGVLTRRMAARARKAPGPTLIRRNARTLGEPPPPPAPACRPGRDRAHRRPRA